MFVGRKEELATLERYAAMDSFQMVVVYGRRRVGKTRLIQEFLRGHNGIYFCAVESSAAKNLELLSEAIYRATGVGGMALPPFGSFEAAFSYLATAAQDKRLVFVIDEYPYLAASEPSISSILQSAVDSRLAGTKMMLILCGSSMSFMERQVLGYQSPLYGRRTAQLRVLPLGYRESALFVPSWSCAERAVAYGVTGGVPRYLELFDVGRSLRDNLIALFLRPDGYLFEEPGNLLKQELREPAVYNAVIEAVARGASRLNEIATALKRETSAVAPLLNNLLSLGILCKKTPLTEEKNARKTIYAFADPMFGFWYRFVSSGLYLIQSGEAEHLYDSVVGPGLPQYMGHVYETMCAQWLTGQSRLRKTPFVIERMGTWWGTNPRTHGQEEIDILAAGEGGTAAIFGECKFKNAPAGLDTLRSLREKANCLPAFSKRFYHLFSKGGFTSDLSAAAKGDPGVALTTLEELYD